jgi:hypothetical protein
MRISLQRGSVDHPTQIHPIYLHLLYRKIHRISLFSPSFSIPQSWCSFLQFCGLGIFMHVAYINGYYSSKLILRIIHTFLIYTFYVESVFYTWCNFFFLFSFTFEALFLNKFNKLHIIYNISKEKGIKLTNVFVYSCLKN